MRGESKSMDCSRRNFTLAMMALVCAVGARAQDKRIPKELIPSVPVFPWLKIGETSYDAVRATYQRMISSSSPKPWFRDGISEITGGAYLTISELSSKGMAGELGLKVITTVFDTQKKAQMAIFLLDRGWNDANVSPLIARMEGRYTLYADPIRVQDDRGESSDYYIIFDMGRFIVEVSIPQHGTFLSVYFTTKELHRKIRIADGTYELFKKHLER